jgi:murein DD-endopeptidase MepM/ murein hydrolase activator NlpD
MNKIFYRYNPHTLTYDRVHTTIGQRIWRIFRHLCLGVLIGGALFAASFFAFDSPKEQQLKKDLRLLLTQYRLLSKRIDENEKILKELQYRDDDFYRLMFNANPLPSSLRRPGIGGVERYEYLMDVPDAKTVITTAAKLDHLTRQLYVQSNSYDELAELLKNKEERMRCIPAIMPLAGRQRNQIRSGFGMRMHPIYGRLRMHTGIDLNAPSGTPIYATGGGTIESTGWQGGYGYTVVIDHGFGFKSLYAHCQKMTVRAGQKVVRGQQVATVGITGDATGPHVHYEVILRGTADNPVKYFFLDLTPEEYDQMLFEAENR